jgi:hypothetical protein
MKSGTLRAGDPDAMEVAHRFDDLIQYACLSLGQKTGLEVRQILNRKEKASPKLRYKELATSLAQKGPLTSTIGISGAGGQLHVVADLSSMVINCYVDVPAPKRGTSESKVRWLLDLLELASGHKVWVEGFASKSSVGKEKLIDALRASPVNLIRDTEKTIQYFRVSQRYKMGSKQGTGIDSFIDSVLDATEKTHAELGSTLMIQHAKRRRRGTFSAG